VIDNRELNAAACDCTTQQQNTHITETRVILYPWHPWHGRAVWIVTTVTKNGQQLYRCALELPCMAQLLEVPRWMFDSMVCCRMQLAASPSVELNALLELKRVLSGTSAGNAVMLQIEHHSLSNPGGADAIHAEPTTGNSTQFVSSSSENSPVDAGTSGDTPSNPGAIDTVIAAPLPRLARHRHCKGGA
jgi:hypothetical protein